MVRQIAKFANSERFTEVPGRLKRIVSDRVQVNSVLIVLSFVSVLLLNSQSAASWPTYFLALGMLASVRQWNDVFRLRMVWALAGLVGWLVLSGLWSSPWEIDDFVSMLIRGLLTFLFVVAFAEGQIRGHLQRWLGLALTVAGVGAAIAAILLYYEHPPVDGRLAGVGINTQVIAALVHGVVLMFLLNAVLTERSPAWKAFAAVGILIVGSAIYLSDSRTAWVSVSLGASIFALSHMIRNRARFVPAVILLAVGLLVMTLALAMTEAGREFVLPRGTSYRPEIWRAALDRILDGNLWVGLGVNTSDDFVIDGQTFLHPHDLYLAVLYHGGIVALGFLVALILLVLRSLWRNYEALDAKLALGLFSGALSAFLLDGHELVDKVGAAWLLFWLPVALALGLEWRRVRCRHRVQRASEPEPVRVLHKAP